MSIEEMDKYWKENYLIFYMVAIIPIIIGFFVILILQYLEPSFSPEFFRDALDQLKRTNDLAYLLPIAAWGLASIVIGPSIGMMVGFIILYSTSKISWKELFWLQFILKTPTTWLSE
jgi:hypothetical protein